MSPRTERQEPRRFLRPCTFGLVALALLIVTWGLGYRLSEYQTKIAPSSRTTVAKMWTDTRRDSVTIEGRRASILLLLAQASLSWDVAGVGPSYVFKAPEFKTRFLGSFQRTAFSRGPPPSLLA